MKRIIFFFLFIPLLSHSQTLKRIGGIGALFTTVNDSVANANGMASKKGLLITQILPGETAEAIGLKKGDIVFNINGVDVNTPFGIYSNHSITRRTGDEVVYKIVSDKKEMTIKGIALTKPYEKSDEYDIFYDQFPFRNGLIRAIVSKPKDMGSKKPAILIIQGYPCQSVDLVPAFNTYKQIEKFFVKKGFIVMRAEKPGMGDNLNTPPCNEIDFNTEVEAFRGAYIKMRSLPDADTSNLFIFGHSMGGMVAPFIASELKPKGVIVYGVTIKTWYEYLLDLLRYQNPSMGGDYKTLDSEMLSHAEMLYQIMLKNKMPSELIKETSEYKELLEKSYNYSGGEQLWTRHARFWQTLNKAAIAAEWTKVNSYVLSAYGEYDIQSINDFSHKELAKIVNTYSPGKATYIMFPATEHSFVELENEQDKFDMYTKPGMIQKILQKGVNQKAMEQIYEWMNVLIGR